MAMAAARTVAVLSSLLAIASGQQRQQQRSRVDRPPRRADLVEDLGGYMMDCVRRANGNAAEVRACRDGAKARFVNNTANDTEFEGGRGEALFEKVQRDAMERKAGSEVRGCLEGNSTSQEMRACMTRAKQSIGSEMEGYMRPGKPAAEKTAKKLQMEREASRDVLGEIYSSCMRTGTAEECRRSLASRKDAAGLGSEDSDGIVKRHFAKTLKGVSDNCTSGDLRQCREAAKQQAMQAGMKRREYAQAKKLGEVKAAAELWATCKEAGETDATCEGMIRDEFVKVSGARAEDFDQATKDKVKRLGAAIQRGTPLRIVKFKRMKVDALVSGENCTTVLENLFAAKCFNISKANNSNVSRAIARRCRIVDEKADLGAAVEANIPDADFEALSDAADEGLSGANLISRRLQEAGLSEEAADDLARRLATVDEVFAAQDMEECAEGDTTCDETASPGPGPGPSPTPSPSPGTVAGAHRAAALAATALVAVVGSLCL